MICCICGESLDFGKPIGDIVMTNYHEYKFMCKDCKKLKEEVKKL